MLQYLQCPTDLQSSLQEEEGGLRCNRCKKFYPAAGGKFFFRASSLENLPHLRTDPKDRARWTSWRKRNFEFLAHNLKELPDAAVVADIGVGNDPFSDLISRFHQVIGIDIDPNSAASVIANSAALPLRDGSCDCVILTNHLEHVPDPRAVLSEAIRITRSGGFIIGTAPFLKVEHSLPYDFLRYTHIMLSQLLAEAGYRDVRVESVSAPIDVYETMSHIFFDNLIAGFSAKPRRSSAKVFAARLARKTSHLWMHLFRPIFKQAPASFAYTEGYGFFGRKPDTRQNTKP